MTRDLRVRYGADYRVVAATSGAEALEVLAELALRDRPVALVASDQRMPGMTGIEVLGEVRRQAPDTKLLLLTAYADTDVAIRAINDIGLDYYMLKPWDPPEEHLYPVVDDLLGDWREAHRDDSDQVRVVGHRWSDRAHEVKTFLARNHVPYRVARRRAGRRRAAARRPGAGGPRRPAARAGARRRDAAHPDDAAARRRARAPDHRRAAALRPVHRRQRPRRAWPPRSTPRPRGCGPSSSSATPPGGQAGQSASIENYLGFPKGLSGADLTHRAVAQAARFGAEMVLARDVVGFEQRGPVRAVLLDGGGEVEARAVLIATGVSYRGSRRRGSSS